LSEDRRSRLGKQGEELAVAALIAQGYRVIARNYRNRYGEIDIIAHDPSASGKMTNTLVFVEVKTRKNDLFSHPAEAVNSTKQRQICKTALEYLTLNHSVTVDARFDVVAIILPDGGAPQIELIKNAFDLCAGF